MSKRAEVSKRYLKILNELEAHATSSEREFYERMRLKHERIVATENEESKEADTPAALAESLDFGYRELYSMQHELSKSDTDHYWKVWLEQQIELYSNEIKDVENQLQELNFEYAPPKPDFEEIARREKREEIQQEIEGLKILKGLKVSWAERNTKLEEIQQEIAEIQHQLDYLSGKL